jgi:hypothetical protein
VPTCLCKFFSFRSVFSKHRGSGTRWQFMFALTRLCSVICAVVVKRNISIDVF